KSFLIGLLRESDLEFLYPASIMKSDYMIERARTMERRMEMMNVKHVWLFRIGILVHHSSLMILTFALAKYFFKESEIGFIVFIGIMVGFVIDYVTSVINKIFSELNFF